MRGSVVVVVSAVDVVASDSEAAMAVSVPGCVSVCVSLVSALALDLDLNLDLVVAIVMAITIVIAIDIAARDIAVTLVS